MKYQIIDLNDYDGELIFNLLGENDKNIALISQFYNISLIVENNSIFVENDGDNNNLHQLFIDMIGIYENNQIIDQQDIISLLNKNYTKRFISNGQGNKKYYLRTLGQANLYEAFEKNVLTFAIGPAGTGKTFLAVVYAYNLLKKGVIKKIVITRPVVESGESLGFLPGDLKEKVDPYLRPIYDAFESLVGAEGLAKFMERGIIEIAPLAYMRGRTLNDCCIILDEAQNTIDSQIKMFMTRLGFNSKMIITGDITQIDLPSHKQSGLIKAMNIVKDIDEVAIVNLSNKDVVRHPVVSKIIEAYQKEEDHVKSL